MDVSRKFIRDGSVNAAKTDGSFAQQSSLLAEQTARIAADNLEITARMAADTALFDTVDGNLSAFQDEIDALEADLYNDPDLNLFTQPNFLKHDGSVLLTGDLDLNSHKLKNVTNPVVASDGANLGTVQTETTARQAAVAALGVCFKESLTLISGDISNQYKDLSFLAITDSLILSLDGTIQYEGDDYSLSVVGGKTRVTFLGDLASGGGASVVAGDKLRVSYRK